MNPNLTQGGNEMNSAPPQPSHARDVFDGPFIPSPPVPPVAGNEAYTNIMNTPVAPPPIPQSSPEIAPWDHDKAEDIAQAMRQSSIAGGYLSNQVGTEGEQHSAQIEQAQSDIKEAIYSGEKPINIAMMERAISRTKEQFTSAIDQKSQPFEILYDLNPDKFAAMPTKEFVALVEELQRLEVGIQNAQTGLDSINDEFTEEKLEALVNGSQGILLQDDIDHIKKSLHIDVLTESDQQSIRDSFDAIIDPWENSGKTVASSVVNLILMVKNMLLTQRDTLIATKETFLDQHRPVTVTYSQSIGGGEYVHTTIDPKTGEELDIRFPDEHEG